MDNDSLNYSVSFGWKADEPAQEPLWIMQPCDIYPLSPREVWLRGKQNGSGAGVAADVAQTVLQFCNVFKNLDGHVREITRAVPALAANGPHIRRILQMLCDRGLMLRAGDVLKQFERGVPQGDSRSLRYVGIRTCDRPGQLARLLDSLLQNEKRHGNRYRYLVVDDSRDPHNRSANTGNVQAAVQAGLSLNYHGEVQQEALIERLCGEFAEQADAVRFLLGGHGTAFTGGRVFNHLLLLSAGRRLVTLDDDALCDARRLAPPDAPEISQRPREPWFFDDLDAALSSTESLDCDPLAEHARLLGLGLQEALVQLAPRGIRQDVLRNLGTDLLADLVPESGILVTYNGVLGDPGAGSNAWLYGQEGAAAQRFWGSGEDEYRRHATQRVMYTGVSGPRLNPNPPLMTTTATGFDNRRLLPPFSPRGRIEDFLFISMLKACHPPMIACELPWGLSHLPEPWRSWDRSATEEPMNIGALSYVSEEVAQAGKQIKAEDPGRRMSSLAQALTDLAQAPSKVLEERIQQVRMARRSGQVNLLKLRMQALPQAPEYWRRDMQSMLEVNMGALHLRDRPLLGDAGEQDLRALLGNLGAGLQLWPRLWACMKEEITV